MLCDLRGETPCIYLDCPVKVLNNSGGNFDLPRYQRKTFQEEGIGWQRQGHPQGLRSHTGRPLHSSSRQAGKPQLPRREEAWKQTGKPFEIADDLRTFSYKIIKHLEQGVGQDQIIIIIFCYTIDPCWLSILNIVLRTRSLLLKSFTKTMWKIDLKPVAVDVQKTCQEVAKIINV